MKFQVGQILVEGGGFYPIGFYRVEKRTKRFITVVGLVAVKTTCPDQQHGWTKFTAVPSDQLVGRAPLDPTPRLDRYQINSWEDGESCEDFRLWDGEPVLFQNY